MQINLLSDTGAKTKAVVHLDTGENYLQFDMNTLEAFLKHYKYLESINLACGGTVKFAAGLMKLRDNVMAAAHDTLGENEFEEELRKV